MMTRPKSEITLRKEAEVEAENWKSKYYEKLNELRDVAQDRDSHHKRNGQLEHELLTLKAERGEAEGRAKAFETAFNRLCRHHELLSGKPEAIKAIAEETAQLNQRPRHRDFDDDTWPVRHNR